MVSAKSIDATPEQLKLIRTILNEHSPGCKVIAYGSKVNGSSTKFSDLDIAVFKADIGQIADIKEAFDESDLPFSVDVMHWEKIPEDFQRNILENFFVLQKDG